MLLLLLLAAAARAAAQDGPFKETVNPDPVGIPGAVDRFLMLTKAEDYRVEALKTAARKLSALKTQVETKAPASAYDADTVRIVASWLSVKPGDARYAAVLQAALAAIAKTQAVALNPMLYPDSKKICDDNDKANGTPGTWAWTVMNTPNVALCRSWLFASAECRRVVVVHEALHSVGLVDVDTKLKFPKRTTAVALTDAAYMAGLFSELHSMHEDRCP